MGAFVRRFCRPHRYLRQDWCREYRLGSCTFIRTIVVLISFLVLLLATGQFATSGPISPRTWTFLVLSGLGTGASWLCYFRALKLGPASMVAPIDKLSVVLVALFAFVFLGERPSATGWLGIALIAAGAVIIAIKA
jgi:transporter family protein